MKKSLIIFFCFIFVILLVSIVSAFSFSEFVNKITGKAVSSVEAPFCSRIGTRSEGWEGVDGFIKYDNCAICKALCLYKGTKDEGWYSSCEERLIQR